MPRRSPKFVRWTGVGSSAWRVRRGQIQDTVLGYSDQHGMHQPKKLQVAMRPGKPKRSQADPPKAKPYLCALPSELLLIVSKHLEIEGLYYFAQTCTYVRGAVGQHLYNERGQHLLLWAASEGKLARAKEVITHGEKININFKESRLTALALVIENYTPEREWFMKSSRMEEIDFTSTAELLLNHPDIDLEDETNGINMLKTAIQTGFGLAVDRLLRYCPSAVNAVLDGFGTPLTFAALLGRTDIIKLLIGRGADVNVRNGVGHTALAEAVFARKHEAANFLLEQHNTDLSKETNGIDVLEKAIESDLCPVVERLLQYHRDRGAYVNTPFDNGLTPLVTAAQWGREKIVDLLVRSEANVNQLTIQRSFDTGLTWTALSMAAKHGHENIVRRLLRCEDIQTDLNSADRRESGDAVFWAAAYS
ncbi:ankyrin repeats (3 copies) domain-containing protein [Cordyceps javanica]|uniref:Ankyrin repeats (3 copies) domain-containing protein n=1 Tax=Cordyceps javanica TaxID=43265 RepID=A0A545UL58_9HYPO|nr:ankyrin repeats (3 copies) domain-containing protein [Cordyceps javanica]